jgi:DNA-binding sugar fermentation-stimulating protein
MRYRRQLPCIPEQAQPGARAHTLLRVLNPDVGCLTNLAADIDRNFSNNFKKICQFYLAQSGHKRYKPHRKKICIQH